MKHNAAYYVALLVIAVVIIPRIWYAYAVMLASVATGAYSLYCLITFQIAMFIYMAILAMFLMLAAVGIEAK